jgi:hypothetical protein
MEKILHEEVNAASSVDEMLADLDMDDIGEENEDLVIESLSADDLSAIEVTEAMDEAYADQEVSTVDVEASEPKAVEAAKPAKAKKAATPRAPKELSSIDPDFFILDTTFAGDTDDLIENQAKVIGRMPTQKKIAEKFDNLFRSLSVGKKPSVYVMACFEALVAKGEVTNADLVAALRASSSRSGAGYNEGTARSQAGQIMVLFDVVGIASRSGQTLTINPNSKIAERLKAL